MNPHRLPSDCAMAPCTVQTSTFYPPIRTRGAQGASLQPLCIGICFSGALPLNLVRGVVVMAFPVSFELIADAFFIYLANPDLCLHC